MRPPPCARWPGTYGSLLAGNFLWVLVWVGACYWHGMGGFVFNSSSSSSSSAAQWPPAGQSADRPRLRVGLTYDAAGSHKTANDVWRGGVLLGALGEANKRMEGRIGGCRGWGRYHVGTAARARQHPSPSGLSRWLGTTSQERGDQREFRAQLFVRIGRAVVGPSSSALRLVARAIRRGGRRRGGGGHRGDVPARPHARRDVVAWREVAHISPAVQCKYGAVHWADV